MSLVPNRYGDKTCRHCRGTGVGPWHMAMGECFRCKNGKAELPKHFYGVTVEREGRTFKGIVRTYDEDAARVEATGLQLFYLGSVRRADGSGTFDDPEQVLFCGWIQPRPAEVVKVVRITLKIADAFIQENDRRRLGNVREVTKKEQA